MTEVAWAIVVAGGEGTRFGSRKQFIELAGASCVEHCVARAKETCDGVVLVVPPDLVDLEVPGVAVVAGGATRSASVRAGLDALPPEVKLVLVHDAARPAASAELFRTVRAGLERGADAVVPGLPVVDTIKQVEQRGTEVVVASTPDRATLVAVQTPQGFRVDRLRDAHATGGEATDDAALIEALGLEVVVVPGEPGNVKLTDPADRDRIEAAILSGVTS